MTNQTSRYYILVGDRRTWQTSLQNKIWGFSEGAIGSWNTSKAGDYAAFYVKSPWKKIIGFGVFGKKFIDDNLIWPDEKIFGRAIWKYRIKLKPISVTDVWKDGVTVPTELMLNTGRKVIPKQLFLSLVNEADKKWDTGIRSVVSG